MASANMYEKDAKGVSPAYNAGQRLEQKTTRERVLEHSREHVDISNNVSLWPCRPLSLSRRHVRALATCIFMLNHTFCYATI